MKFEIQCVQEIARRLVTEGGLSHADVRKVLPQYRLQFPNEGAPPEITQPWIPVKSQPWDEAGVAGRGFLRLPLHNHAIQVHMGAVGEGGEDGAGVGEGGDVEEEMMEEGAE